MGLNAGTVSRVVAGGDINCAIYNDGKIKCWGQGSDGGLGLGDGAADLGDDEAPSVKGFVPLGTGTVAQLAVSLANPCVLFIDGNVNCWGLGKSVEGSLGALGRGQSTNHIGDGETPQAAGVLSLGGTVTKLGTSAASHHVCAILSTNQLKCWGNNATGQLGLGHTNNIGDDELPSNVGTINLGL